MTPYQISSQFIDGTEFLSVVSGGKRVAQVFYNNTLYNFADAPACRKNIVGDYLKANPSRDKAMAGMVGNDETAKIERAIICLFGAFNRTPDIDARGNLSLPEYVPCENRGKCSFEGIGCCNVMVREGLFLSKAETDVFVRVKQADKAIAGELFISVETVKTHFRNIRKKTGLNNKIEMAIWATQMGIL